MGLFTKKKTTEDADAIKGLTRELIVKAFDKNLDPARQMLERTWFLHILYYLGEQYIHWSKSRGTFTRRGGTDLYTPTPVTNALRDSVKSVKALFLNKDYDIRVWPNSNNLDDKKASELGGQFLKDLHTSIDNEFDEEKEKVLLWIFLAGTGFMRTFPELERGEFGIDKNGEFIHSGDIVSQSLIPFSVITDQLGGSLNEKRYIGIESLKPREWTEDTFKVILSGKGGIGGAINYQKKLMKFVSDVSPWKSASIDSQVLDMADEDLVLFRELEFRPSPRFPEGRYVIAAGDQEIKSYNKMPIPVKDGRWFYTITDFHYNYVPGRFLSDAYVTDLISPQNQINSIDQDCEKNRKGVGQPIVTAPKGVTITRLNDKGMGFIVLQYDPYLSGGQTPTISRGTPLPEAVFTERNLHSRALQDVGGDPKNILSGAAPTSQASGVLIDVLRQAAELSHSPDINRFYRKLRLVYVKELILAQQLYTEKRMLKIAGKGKQILVKHFIGADLRNNTDVRLEIASSASLTQAGQTLSMTEMAKSGVFGDLSNEPEIRYQLMQRVGIKDVRDKTNVHIERAENENARISIDDFEDILIVDLDKQVQQGEDFFAAVVSAVNSGNNEAGILAMDDPLFKFDDHKIHYETIRMFILSDEFKELPKQAQTVAIYHADTHKIFMDYQQQQETQMEMMKSGRFQQPQEAKLEEGVTE